MATHVKSSTSRTAARTRYQPDSWQRFAKTLEFWSLIVLPSLLILGAVLLWWLSLSAIDMDSINDFGLVSVLPISFYGALVLLNLSFALVASRQEVHTPTLFLHVFLLVIIIHGTLALVYEVPRYPWTYKHIGVVDYVQRFGMTDPTIDAYQNWPGFFTLVALITEITGIQNLIGIAAWAQLFWNLLYLGALRMIYRSFTNDPRLIWLGIWVFFLTSWVAQDYFAPQAFGFFMHLVVLGIFLTWFRRSNSEPHPARTSGNSLLRRLTRLYYHIVNRETRNSGTDAEIQPIKHSALAAIAILAFLAIVSSHQLTPFMTISTILLLLIFKRCRRQDLLVLMIVLLMTWLAYMSITFIKKANLDVFQSFGQLFSNIDNNLKDFSESSPGRAFVSHVTRLTTLGVWGLAFLGGIRRLRNGYWDLALVLVTVTPFFLIAMQNYGGEMIFRVYLFSLPGMALLIAALLYPAAPTKVSWVTGISVLTVSALLVSLLLYTYFGNERVNHMDRGEVEALEQLYDRAPRGSLILTGSSNSPTRFVNYTRFVHLQLTDIPAFWAGQRWEYQDVPLNDYQLGVLRDFMANQAYSKAYLLISRSQKRYVSAYNVEQADYLDRLEAALRQSDLFAVDFENEDVTLFVLAKERYGVQ